MFTTFTKARAKRRGATILLLVVVLTVLIGMVAFAVDLGRMYLVRSQLQTAVDAGALGATLQLKRDDQDIDAAMERAHEFIEYNRVGWFVTVPEDAIEVVPGKWDSDTKNFSTEGDFNAVSVSANLQNEPLFLAAFLGSRKFGVPRAAIASSDPDPMDIMMVLDLSGSMEDEGRIEALRDAAPAFVDVIEKAGDKDQIGVMGYGALPDEYDPMEQGHNGVEYLSAPSSLYPSGSEWVGVLEATLTDDFSTLRSDVLDSSTLLADKYNSYTPTGAAIRDAAHYLEVNAREGTRKVVVLMSDGHANRPHDNANDYALEMAAYADGLDVRIYTISLGNSADEDLMEKIAAATGGQHFIANGSGDALRDTLTSAFRSVAASIKRAQLVQ